MARLLFDNGPQVGTYLDLKEDTTVIGRDAMGQVPVNVLSLAPLQLRAAGQHPEPCLGRIAERADGRASVGEEEP